MVEEEQHIRSPRSRRYRVAQWCATAGALPLSRNTPITLPAASTRAYYPARQVWGNVAPYDGLEGHDGLKAM